MDKKIAMVVGGFPLLSQTFIVRQAQSFGAVVITNNFLEENTSLYDLSSIKVEDIGLKKHSIQYRLFEGFRSVYARLFKKPFFYWHGSVRNRLYRKLAAGGFQLVLCPFGENAINAVKACKKLEIPLVVQFLGVDASKYLSNPNYVQSLKEVFDYSLKVVVLSDLLGDNLKSIGCPAKKIVKNNIGVPVDEFEPVPLKTGDTFVFTAVGRLVAKKAPLLLLQAFSLCADSNKHAVINMVGKGPLWKEVNDWVKNSPHRSRIRLLGNKSQMELKEIYRDTHVFVQHSIVDEQGDSEGWPVGIAEACASGLPIIATKHSGIIDQVVHGETGYLVKENDVISMGKYMLELSKDLPLCQKMGMASRRSIEKNGNIELQVQKLRQLIDE